MTSEAVIAIPCDMPGGYTFHAVVNGWEIPVTVPSGGVQQGQELRIPIDSTVVTAPPPVVVSPTTPHMHLGSAVGGLDNKTNNSSNNNNGSPTTGTATVIPAKAGTTGRPPFQGSWRYALCDCEQVCCSGLWWNSLLRPALVMGQMLSRMNLDYCGSPASSAQQARNAYTVVRIFFLATLIFNFSMLPGLYLAFFIYAIIFGTKLRTYMRTKYQITTGSTCNDCCCVFWCGCCVSIQMIRHTQPEDDAYDCFAYNGLRNGITVV